MLQQFSAFLKAWQNILVGFSLTRSLFGRSSSAPGLNAKMLFLWEGSNRPQDRSAKFAKAGRDLELERDAPALPDVRLRQQLCSKDKTIVIPEVRLYRFLCCIAASHSRVQLSSIVSCPCLCRFMTIGSLGTCSS